MILFYININHFNFFFKNLFIIILGGSLKASDGQCISINKLKGVPSKGYLAYTWDDLRPNGRLLETDLVVLGDNGKLFFFLSQIFNFSSSIFPFF